jgi:hypothetical protein
MGDRAMMGRGNFDHTSPEFVEGVGFIEKGT